MLPAGWRRPQTAVHLLLQAEAAAAVAAEVDAVRAEEHRMFRHLSDLRKVGRPAAGGWCSAAACCAPLFRSLPYVSTEPRAMLRPAEPLPAVLPCRP